MNHPATALSIDGLARVCCAQEDYEKAEIFLNQSMAISRKHLEHSALAQSERQQFLNRGSMQSTMELFLGITSKMPAATRSTYDMVLSWKGSVTARQRMVRLARTTLAGDAEANQFYLELQALTREIKLWSLKTPEQLPTDFDLPRKLVELSEQRERVEAKLSARTEAFRKLRASQKLTTVELQGSLPVGAVLLDFIVYGDDLAAFVVTRDRLHRVELKKIKPLAEAVDEFRAALKRGRSSPGKNDPARTLREKLLDPLDKHLAGVKLVLIAPDGPLNQLPFAALPGKKAGTYLLEEVAVAIIPVPQMLAELLEPPAAPGQGTPSLLVLGDVDFDAVSGKSSSLQTPPGMPGMLALSGERSGKAFKWNRLPGTVAEMEIIEKIFHKTEPTGPVTLLRAAQASEQVFCTKAPGHDYLHLATHGFFAPKEIERLHIEGPHGWDVENQRVVGYHPGLLSGLVLAGANRASGGSDDGVLTALEVGELDLTRVRLSVLSACETGLGETAGGEGVLGLQRAFHVAGAKTVFSTLWSIPDEATQVLMARFYDNLWSKKMSMLESLREAQLWMLREGRTHPGVLRGAEREELPAETAGRLPPYYWAAFVLSGDWR